jgi:hypothetical protein
MILAPYVPRAASIHEAVYCYLSVERAVLQETESAVTNWATQYWGPSWHHIMVSDPLHESLSGWDSPNDPFYMLKAIAKIPKTPLRGALPPHPHLASFAMRVFHNRNSWAHFGNNQLMHSIKNDIQQLVVFATLAEFDVAARAKEAYEALDTLTKAAGGLVIAPVLKVATASVARAPETEDELPNVPDPMVVRPRVGSPWESDLPMERLELNVKQRDLLDTQTGQSVKDRWPTAALAEQVVKRWFDLSPSTPFVHVDPDDGATVGFLEGYPYLIGYVGEEPDSPEGQYRGFLSDAIYVYEGDGLATHDYGSPLEMSTENRQAFLHEVKKRRLPQGEAFQISNYGDLVHLSDDGPVRVMTLSEPSSHRG